MAYETPLATPIVIPSVFLPLTILAVVARFYARHTRKAGLKIDDWMLLPCLALVIGNCVIMVILACYGQLGKKVALSPQGKPLVTDEYVVFQKCFLAQQAVVTSSLAFTRFSILLLYHRVFGKGSKWFNICIWILYILNAIWGVSFVCTQIFNCYPISDTWTLFSGAAKRHCLTPHTFAHIRGFAVSSIFLDTFVLTLPWSMVMRLKLSGRNKAGILAIFMLGALVVGTAIGKAVVIYEVTAVVHGKQLSIQYDEAPFFYWSVPETCIALICACLPTLRPIFLRLYPGTIISSIRTTFVTRRGSNNGTTRGTRSKSGAGAENESTQKFARLSDGNPRLTRDEEAAWEVELDNMQRKQKLGLATREL